jgi:hypothetical protein
MTNGNEEQERMWELLYDQIKRVVQHFGTEDYLGGADYLLVDDNYGWRRHTIEIHKLPMLNPELVRQLQSLLEHFTDWEIVIAVDIPGTETTWPRMGITIRRHEIIDGLQREYLPSEFRAVRYEGSRPGTGYD